MRLYVYPGDPGCCLRCDDHHHNYHGTAIQPWIAEWLEKPPASEDCDYCTDPEWYRDLTDRLGMGAQIPDIERLADDGEMRDIGMHDDQGGACGTCGLYQVGDVGPVCPDCDQCDECGHADDCENADR